MTPATESKRDQLRTFIKHVLEPEAAVQAVVGIGSIATGHIRSDSDIDAVVFFDPMDWYIIPAEFIWRPSDGTFHSIFTGDGDVLEEGISLDCRRLDLNVWADPGFEWPEGRRAELANGWVAFDRGGQVEQLIARRTAYPEEVRQERLDEAIVWLDQHLADGAPEAYWRNLGPTIAHDRLQAACHYLVRLLFVYNRRWLPWRNRQIDALLALSWLPENFAERVLTAANAPSLDFEGYMAQAGELRQLLEESLSRLVSDGLYSTAPIDQAFIRSNDEPGFSWNMDDWNGENLTRLITVVSDSPSAPDDGETLGDLETSETGLS